MPAPAPEPTLADIIARHRHWAEQYAETRAPGRPVSAQHKAWAAWHEAAARLLERLQPAPPTSPPRETSMCGGDDGTAPDMLRNVLSRQYLDHRRSQHEVARQLGCTQSYLSLMANGRRRISAAMAARMERLGMPGEAIWLAQAVEELTWARDHLDDRPRQDGASAGRDNR